MLIYFLFLIIVVFASLVKTPWFKGIIGEFQVNSLLISKLDQNKYTILKNVTLPARDGTTQIDHIVISQFGIFVIETKNYSGWIFGNENQPKWTQVIFKVKNSFQNPLRQNNKHLKTLEEITKLPASNFHSVVVFTGDAEFKSEIPDNVLSLRKLIEHIKSFNQKLLFEKEIIACKNCIEKYALKKSLSTNRIHRKNVENIMKNNGMKPYETKSFISSIIGSSIIRSIIKFIVIFIFILSLLSALPFIIQNLTKNILFNHNISNSNNTKIDNQNFHPSSKKQNIIKTVEINKASSAKSQKFRGVIYSWTDNRGHKVFSNVGFPKDGNYKDGKIEWQ